MGHVVGVARIHRSREEHEIYDDWIELFPVVRARIVGLTQVLDNYGMELRLKLVRQSRFCWSMVTRRQKEQQRKRQKPE